MKDEENKPYSQELLNALGTYLNVANYFLAGNFPIEEFDDRLKVAFGKMEQEEFDIKWGYKKEQLKCMELYKQMLNL